MRLHLLIAASLLAGTAYGQFRISPADRTAGYALDYIVVKFRTNDVSRLRLPLVESAFGKWLRAKRGGPTNYDHFLYCRVPPGATATSLVAALRKDAFVQFAELDSIGDAGGVHPDDTYFSQQWSLRANQATNAWDISEGSSNVILAVLDSGIDASLPDFAGRLVPGYDFINNDSDPSDDTGHGTAVAEIAAATGSNGVGIAGMDWRCRIMPIKTLNVSDDGAASVAAQGIYWAMTNGAKVINLSSGWPDDSAALAEAISNAVNAGCIFVCITHNQGMNSNRFPANLDICISVGSTDEDDHHSSFSNHGPGIDLVAPGTNLWVVDSIGPLVGWGTSFSAPQVSGVAALLAGMITNLDQQMCRTLLCAGADDQVGDPSEDTPGYDLYHGFGRLNAWATLQLAMTTLRTADAQGGHMALTWASPFNASNKHPFKVEFASDLNGAWTTNASSTNLVFSKTNTVWTDAGTTTGPFYRVRVDED